jgi:hypothetical protein
VLGRHSTPGTKRERLIEQVFLSCCQDGLVGDAVLRDLQYASTFVYDKLVGSKLSAASDSLPQEWQCNIRVVNATATTTTSTSNSPIVKA